MDFTYAIKTDIRININNFDGILLQFPVFICIHIDKH